MTISGYSSAIVDTMLGWLKGFANWVLRLFNLAGSVSASPLAWLSRNWLKLLILLLLIGVAADVLVWLIRWRPHWVWLRKERVIVNDDSFFSDEGIMSESEWEDELERNWHERDYVVASTVVKRNDAERAREGSSRPGGRPGRTRPSTVVRRHDAADGGLAQPGASGKNGGSVRRGEKRRDPGARSAGRGSAEAEEKVRSLLAEREGDLFGMDGNQPDVTDFYEDEVFNVSNLPRTDDYPFEDKT